MPPPRALCVETPQAVGEQGQQEGQCPDLPQWQGSGGLQGCADGPQCCGVTGAGRGHGAGGRKGLGGRGLSREETLKLDLQGACGPLAAPSLLLA